MKTIGIIGAMDEEIEGIKSALDIISTKKIVGIDFYLGKMNGKSIVLVRCGIGKVNAAICTQILIDLYAVDYIINIGVAGGLNPALSIGDIVVSDNLIHHDFDTTAAGDGEIGLIPRLNMRLFKADERLINLAVEAGRTAEHNVFVGRIASGDRFVAASEEKRRIIDQTGAMCVEMEGAAIAQTCFLNKIPFVVIRAISDNADEAASVSFSDFVVMAAANSTKMIRQMLISL